MGLNSGALIEAIRQWLVVSSGLNDNHVIQEHQPGPQPTFPYIQFNPTLFVESYGLYDESIPGSGLTTHVQRRKITVEVNVYGETGKTYPTLEAAYDGVELLSVQQILDSANLALIDKGKAQHLSFLMETQFNERYRFEATFSAVGTNNETVVSIDTVETIGTLTYSSIDTVSTSGTFTS